MMDYLFRRLSNIDWLLLVACLPILGVGLLSMNSFTENSYYFDRQIIWIGLALIVFLVASLIDWRFLRKSEVVVGIYILGILALLGLYLFSEATRNTYSWLSVGGLSIQPVEFVKLLVIIILAKYFTRRHIEIARIRHIIISGLYAFVPFVLVFLQPDLGSAMIIFFIWLGMVLASGISKKHLLIVFSLGLIAFMGLWFFVLADYQKARITSFVNPLADVQGSGYNAFQSTVAVGSGQLMGKGVGLGSQSRLKFLPEHQTDFIFAAFAEEWGFVGVIIFFILFGFIIWRILRMAKYSASNFETLFAIGFTVMLMSHFIIHVGMNIGLLPITGLPMPFMSYGGSFMIVVFLGLGILMGMRRYSLAAHRLDIHNEFVGPN